MWSTCSASERRSRSSCLSNGVKLRGTVSAFDAFYVLLDRDGHQQIVYKHAITTTSPAHAVDVLRVPNLQQGEIIQPAGRNGRRLPLVSWGVGYAVLIGVSR